MQEEPGVAAIAHVIQLAVAPVFLLSGIGALLSVMTNRLGRVVDRARVLEHAARQRGGPEDAVLMTELVTLSRRAALIGRSIALCTITALLVAAVIAALFLGAFLGVNPATTVAWFFIAAMVSLFLGLLLFLREILLATSTLRIGLDHVRAPQAADGPGGQAPSAPRGPPR
jgi:hypothetical protein